MVQEILHAMGVAKKLEMQIVRSYLKLTESETLGARHLPGVLMAVQV